MYFFVINNQSGKGIKVWNKTKPLLTKMNIVYKAYIITNNNDLLNIKKDILNYNIKALVIIGGDGTIQKALHYIENTSIPIGVIPAGSGNDFARALKIPKNYRKALDKILNGNKTAIDVMQVNNHSCLTIVGVGFDAKVADVTNRSKIKKWLNYFRAGKFAYVFSVLRTVFCYKPTDIEIEIDGKTTNYKKVWLIAIANTAFYGGGLKICPDANEKDHTLNICIAHSLSKFEILMFFPLVFLGKHTLHRSVATFKGKYIKITSKENVAIQADGEMLGTTPVLISIKSNKLNIIN